MTAILLNSVFWDRHWLDKIDPDMSRKWDKVNHNQIGYFLRDILLLIFFYYLFKLQKIQIILNPSFGTEMSVMV